VPWTAAKTAYNLKEDTLCSQSTKTQKTKHQEVGAAKFV